MRNICMATACVVVLCVCIAGAVILKGDFSSSSSSSSVVTTYGLSAAVSLNGITAAQFDSTAQASFRSTVANQFSVSSSAVTINSYSRRAVAVDFTVALATRPTAANATALTNFITSSGSNGLVSQLNIALSSTNSSATITSVAVTRSVAVVGRTANGWGNVPTSAPTSAPTPPPTPAPTRDASGPWIGGPGGGGPELNPNWVAGITYYVDPSGSDSNDGLSPATACAKCGCVISKIAALSSWPANGVEVKFSQGTHVLGYAGSSALHDTGACMTGSTEAITENRATAAAPLVFSGNNTVIDATAVVGGSGLQLVNESEAIGALINPAIKGQNKLYKFVASSVPDGQVEFNGLPLTPARWPNSGNAIIKTIYDSGAYYTSGRSTWPEPLNAAGSARRRSSLGCNTASGPCNGMCSGSETNEYPGSGWTGSGTPTGRMCGANFSLASAPTGDWAAEFAFGNGFATNVMTNGYFFYDWWNDKVRIGNVETKNGDFYVRLADFSRYGVCQQMCPGGCASYHDDGENSGSGGRRLLSAQASQHKPAFVHGTRRSGSCGGSSPGRFVTTGLLSEVDSPGEYYVHSASNTLYIYPPQHFFDAGANTASATISQWKNRKHFVVLQNTKYVTVRGFTIKGISSDEAIVITGGNNNIIGGNTIKSCANGIKLEGGYRNKILGNDVYDISSNHIKIEGNSADGLHNLVPTNNLVANNHFTQAYLRFDGAWKIAMNGQGTRFSHNLIHDSPIQVTLPGENPMSMYEYNELFNTGYGEGDGGAMYMKASLISGYGSLFKGNYLHHSMEVPGLHGRGGIYFDDHCNSVELSTENVFYKCAGRPFLVNGGAGNNITGNLFMNSGQGIFQQAYTNKIDCTGTYGDSCSNLAYFDTGVKPDGSAYNQRGDKSDYVWKAERELGLPVIGNNPNYAADDSKERNKIFNWLDIFNTSMAKRWPKFAYLMSYNSTIMGWGSAANSTFTYNLGLNVTTNVIGSRRRRGKPSGIVCFRRGWSGNSDLKCDADIDTGTLNSAHHNAPMRNLIDTTGNYHMPENEWDANFPEWRQMEFVNPVRKLNTKKAGLYCDSYRRKMPIKSVYRPWVKQFFEMQPSCMKDCGVSGYSATTASFLASMSSGMKLITDPSFSADCPALGRVDCESYLWPWSGCRDDGTQIMRYTISQYPANGGTACAHSDGHELTISCGVNKWTPINPLIYTANFTRL